MRGKQFIVKLGLGCERIFYISIEIDSHKAAAIIWTEGYLATRIGRNGLKTEVGIAVGHRFTSDCVPEQHARLGRFPCIIHNLAPKCTGIGVNAHLGLVTPHRKLAAIHLTTLYTAHELIVNLDRDIRACNLALFEFCINKTLRVGMLD